MIEIYVLVGSIVFLLAVWLLGRRRRSAKNRNKDQSLRRLEEVINATQLTNDGFFRSLELVQRNLESLLTRAENAEQRLRSLMLQPGVEKKEQYTAAALLLAEGQEPQRVASVLNVPLPQVQIVQELQKLAVKDRKAPGRKKREADAAQQESAAQAKYATAKEKSAARPILLVDAIRSAAHHRDSETLGGLTAYQQANELGPRRKDESVLN